MNRKVVIIVSLVTLFLLGGGIWIATRPAAPKKNLDTFAKCLASKNITMYGAYWCPHCQAEKALFGDSFQYVPYVECTVEIKKCTDANISGYPTWVTSDGKHLEGEQTLSHLSEITSCPLSQ
jgi:hypothetical protein